MVVQLHGSIGLESCEQERLDKFFKWHPVLQSQRDGDGKAIHEASEGRPLLVHIQENLTKSPVYVFTRSEVEFVPSNIGLLGVPDSSCR